MVGSCSCTCTVDSLIRGTKDVWKDAGGDAGGDSDDDDDLDLSTLLLELE